MGWMFWRRANLLDSMLEGIDVIASFQYPAHLLQKLAETVREERLQKNTVRFIFISLIVGVVAVLVVILLLADKSYQVIGPLLLVFLLLEALLYAASKLSPAAAYRRLLKSNGKVIIASTGLLFCAELHVWKAFMTRLTRVYLEKKKTGLFLCFRYAYYVFYLPPVKNIFEVSIPFFDLEESEEITQKVLAYF